MKIILKNVVLRWENIFEPKRYQDKPENKPRYQATIRTPLDGPQAKQVLDAALAACEEAYPGKGEQMLGTFTSKGDLPYLTVPRTNKDGDVYEDTEGCLTLAMANGIRPRVRDRDGVTDLLQADGRPYAGCEVHVITDVYVDKRYNRVNATLMGVQFVADGEAFGGSRVAGEDDFVAVPADELI